MAETQRQSTLTLADAGSQGLVLLAGMGSAQALSFVRNAVLGHSLSPRDFGIAASITLLLQLVETLSDLGHDRLIVQAPDGESDRFLAATHAVAVARGLLLGAMLLLLAPWAAHFFAVPDAAPAFAAVAIVPVLKGFVHMECRRAQRRFDNRPQMLVEVVPQAVALIATLPLVRWQGGYEAVVTLAILQALSAVAMARLLSPTPFRLTFDGDITRRLIAFGWPILLSALPLVAVYQGDRAIVGRLIGVEALAAYSAAFMLAMVPGLLAARASQALMLPIFAELLRHGRALAPRFAIAAEATTVLAALYLSVFTIAGGTLLKIAFGPAYAGHGALIGALATMWAFRMLQAVPGMALMAAGETKPFLIAGLIRALALPAALYAALAGMPLAMIAAPGCAGELASLLYVAARLSALQPGLASILLLRALFILPVGIASALLASTDGGAGWTLAIAALTALSVLASGIVLMPSLLPRARHLLAHVFAAKRLRAS